MFEASTNTPAITLPNAVLQELLVTAGSVLPLSVLSINNVTLLYPLRSLYISTISSISLKVEWRNMCMDPSSILIASDLIERF